MHELSLIQSLLTIVEQYAGREKFSRVRSLKLSFGRLSCLDRKSLEFAFSVQSAATIVEGAALDFEILPARIYCFSCEEDIVLPGALAEYCPRCQGQDIVLSGGTEELKLLEMDVD
ncbi:MAG: hydrogenase maturation nickel metallochaperone HypA [Desulfobulbaceae bacterium]|jgi:hydrogenase nickel incorporation protein HypA/HybF|nr:hydrogenase maturation nickel metallochaperone HypA [Desulfobulbaceae bacterium]